MGFMKIRYFGFLAHKNKKQAIALIRKLIDPDAKLPGKIVETIMEMMLRLTGTGYYLLSQMWERKNENNQEITKSLLQFNVVFTPLFNVLSFLGVRKVSSRHNRIGLPKFRSIGLYKIKFKRLRMHT